MAILGGPHFFTVVTVFIFPNDVCLLRTSLGRDPCTEKAVTESMHTDQKVSKVLSDRGGGLRME